MSNTEHNHPTHEHGNAAHPEVTEAVAQKEKEKINAPEPLTLAREFKFSFKKQKITNELGEEVRRPPVTLSIPIPTFTGLLSALDNDPKVVQYILDLVETAVKSAAGDQVSDEEKPVNSQEQLDVSKLTLEYIANLPKSERTGGGIAKETWEEFEKDYIETMVPIRAVSTAGGIQEATNRVAKAAKILAGRYNLVRSDKQAIKFLREQLAVWIGATKNQDDYAEVYQYLDGRANELLTKDNVSQLASL